MQVMVSSNPYTLVLIGLNNLGHEFLTRLFCGSCVKNLRSNDLTMCSAQKSSRRECRQVGVDNEVG